MLQQRWTFVHSYDDLIQLDQFNISYYNGAKAKFCDQYILRNYPIKTYETVSVPITWNVVLHYYIFIKIKCVRTKLILITTLITTLRHSIISRYYENPEHVSYEYSLQRGCCLK